jgi:aspartate aminotransferase
VSSPSIINMLGKLTNTTLSCVPPFTQIAATAALNKDLAECDRRMKEFERKVVLLVDALNNIDGIKCLRPGGSFYAFPNVKPICNRLGITSHGLAMYFLQAADEAKGVACLGGECFGAAGAGFLRLSTAEPDPRLREAANFIAHAINQPEKVARFLSENEKYRLAEAYAN